MGSCLVVLVAYLGTLPGYLGMQLLTDLTDLTDQTLAD